MNGYFRLNTFIRDFILKYTGSQFEWVVIKYYPHSWNTKKNSFELKTLDIYIFKLNELKCAALSGGHYKKLLCKYPDNKQEWKMFNVFNNYVVEWYGKNDKMFIEVTDLPNLLTKRK